MREIKHEGGDGGLHVDRQIINMVITKYWLFQKMFHVH
jgi:hypothetical protein